ncbi:SCO family protein [Aggregatilineales bacterium SYSU G02658]
MPAKSSSNVLLFAVVAVLIVAIAAVAGFILLRELNAPPPPTPFLAASDVVVIDPPQPTDDWTLTDSSGQPFSAAQLNGKPSVLFFGFANCPDICPLTLREFQRVRRALGDDADRVNFVFISVDGNRDTPEFLRFRLEQLGVTEDIIALTGDPDLVRQIGRPFSVDFVYSAPNESGFYLVDHTASYFVLDSQRRWVQRFAFGTDRVTILEALQAMLATGA